MKKAPGTINHYRPRRIKYKKSVEEFVSWILHSIGQAEIFFMQSNQSVFQTYCQEMTKSINEYVKNYSIFYGSKLIFCSGYTNISNNPENAKLYFIMILGKFNIYKLKLPVHTKLKEIQDNIQDNLSFILEELDAT
jgi:hypothetical protein